MHIKEFLLPDSYPPCSFCIFPTIIYSIYPIHDLVMHLMYYSMCGNASFFVICLFFPCLETPIQCTTDRTLPS